MADKSIVDLPQLSEVTDATLIPVYQPNSDNPAQKMPSSVFRNWAEDAVFPAAKMAQEASVTAVGAKTDAQSALVGVQNAIKNIPAGSTLIVNDLTTGGVSMALSAEMGKYIGSKLPLEGMRAAPALERAKLVQGSATSVEAKGWYRIATMATTDSAVFCVGNSYKTDGPSRLLFYVYPNSTKSSIVALSYTEPSARIITQIRVVLLGNGVYGVDVYYYRNTANTMYASAIAFSVSGTSSIDMAKWTAATEDSGLVTVSVKDMPSGSVLTDANGLLLDGSNAMTGVLNINPDSGDTALKLKTIVSTNRAYVAFQGVDGTLGCMGYNGVGVPTVYTDTAYPILHTGNKPSGSYTGNGSAAARTINTKGIGNTLMIYRDDGIVFALVTPNGALTVITREDIKMVGQIPAQQIKFVNGVLTIATINGNVNNNGNIFNYQVL